MKSYTDIEQSKKLAEILPIKSADMEYILEQWIDEKTCRHQEEYYEIPVVKVDDDDDCPLQPITHPCWSLAALFGVLPTTIGNFFEKNALRLRMDKGENDFNIWYETFDCGDVAEGLDVKEDNPVDACVELILKLYEQKLL